MDEYILWLEVDTEASGQTMWVLLLDVLKRRVSSDSTL